MSGPDDPSPEQLRHIYQDKIGPQLFRRAHGADRPLLVLVGGQPGAGKSAAMARVGGWHEDRAVTTISGDDFRPYHPHYAHLRDADPLGMPNATASASGAWVRMALQEAQARRYSIALEGVFRDAQVVADTARRFADNGWDVHAVALAVPPALSRLSTIQRFVDARENHQPARWTPPGAHDSALAGIPATVRALGVEPAVARVSILDRDGTALADLTDPASPDRADRAEDAYLRGRDRDLTPEEAHAFHAQAATIGPRLRAVLGVEARDPRVGAALHHLRTHDERDSPPLARTREPGRPPRRATRDLYRDDLGPAHTSRAGPTLR